MLEVRVVLDGNEEKRSRKARADGAATWKDIFLLGVQTQEDQNRKK